MKPAWLGVTAVKLYEIPLASAGIPQVPFTTKLRVVLPLRIGAPSPATRVSMIRHGVSGKNWEDCAAACCGCEPISASAAATVQRRSFPFVVIVPFPQAEPVAVEPTIE